MEQRNLLISNGYVITMDPATEDLPRSDVRIADGVIQEVGTDLPAARAWHLEEVTGSLAVGKRGDAIVVDARRPHLQPLNEPVTTIVMNAGPSDVDTVIVDGEIVKSGGALVGPHAERALRLVAASNEQLMMPPRPTQRSRDRGSALSTVPPLGRLLAGGRGLK